MADLSITVASVIAATGADTQHGTAGATITAGQPVYADASDSNKLKLAQADGTAAEADAVGISLHAALSGQPLRYVRGGTINIGATTAKTTQYVVSAAAGGVAPQADLTSGQRIVYLGYATATDGTFVVRIANTGAVV
jgi:hypothetical protein